MGHIGAMSPAVVGHGAFWVVSAAVVAVATAAAAAASSTTSSKVLECSYLGLENGCLRLGCVPIVQSRHGILLCLW